MLLDKNYEESSPRVVIIGTGAGGLACGISLKHKLGFRNFTIYEKADEVGGTWRGCSSDVDMAFFSLSTDLRNWKESHGSQQDIWEYWISLAKKYGLYPYIVFNHMVTSAEWDNDTQLYNIVTKNTLTGEKSTTTAHILISAIGILETPRYASIPGLNAFKGAMFHSARWDKTVELKGKRGGVVGNGASATQFVPIISEDPSVEVLQFCRTPHWVLPSIRKTYSPLWCRLVSIFPLLKLLSRYAVFFKSELMYGTVFANPIFRGLITKLLTKYITNTAPKEYHDKLVPKYTLGCKRVIFDTNYLAGLHRPNLDLNWDGIDTIVEDGILTKTGQHIPLDVLIFATGYAADYYPFPIKGNTEKTIQEYYEEQKGPKAYRGTTVPGFPNFFLISGPNTATGHTSAIYTTEVQINYIMQLIQPILERKVLSLEVSVEATDEYNEKLHSQLSKSVFTQCLSWYRIGGTGKVTNAFPSSATVFWLWLRRPDWYHYWGVGADKWLKEQRLRQRRRPVLRLLFLGVLVLAAYGFHTLNVKLLRKGWNLAKNSTDI
ncbi:hypothetical protein BDZ97DRAFT_1827382 [Flammula alnicola]|nr:hypothetical protein BDZ97DRAFT_1827382 [Flammula alnicola]